MPRAVRRLALGCLFIVGCAPVPGEPDFAARVVAVHDGDTVTVLRDLSEIRVRLHGVDCPEHGQPFGTKARLFTADACFGQVVTIQRRDKDRYGRLIAEVILPDGRILNEELLRAGLAWHYKQFSRNPILGRLEAEARDAHRGLWSDAHPIAPWEWRRNGKDGSRQRESSNRLAASSAAYWLSTESGIRHNHTCKHFGKTQNGRPCRPQEGSPCKLCGG